MSYIKIAINGESVNLNEYLILNETDWNLKEGIIKLRYITSESSKALAEFLDKQNITYEKIKGPHTCCFVIRFTEANSFSIETKREIYVDNEYENDWDNYYGGYL